MPYITAKKPAIKYSLSFLNFCGGLRPDFARSLSSSRRDYPGCENFHGLVRSASAVCQNHGLVRPTAMREVLRNPVGEFVHARPPAELPPRRSFDRGRPVGLQRDRWWSGKRRRMPQRPADQQNGETRPVQAGVRPAPIQFATGLSRIMNFFAAIETHNRGFW